MKKKFTKILGLILVIAMCISVMPLSAFAAMEKTDTTAIEKGETVNNPDETPPVSGDEPNTGPNEDAPIASPTTSPAASQTPPSEENLTTPPVALSPVIPELAKVVSEPLVKVVYHYYDESQSVTDFAGYAVASSHAYYAIAMANGEHITIAANKYPGLVPVSTDALRFRVLLNGSEDITSVAAYDAASGLVFLPQNYMGHEINVEWYCPTSEITTLPVKLTICIGQSGQFTTTTIDLTLASNESSITVPLSVSNGLVVSQNGIDLAKSLSSVKSGNLTISASAFGGDISVSAYALSIMPFGTGFSQVAHTRSADQIYYGYYTSYYTANGNTAFCLDPNASGLASGTYSVSRFLQRGADNTLIKCAYYLYGGPGWNSVKNSLFQSPDTMTAYGLCHAAASYVYLNNDSAFKGLSSSMKDALLNLISRVSSYPMPPDGFDAFIYNESSSTTQSLMGWDYSEPSEPPLPPAPPADGDLEIVKVSSNPSMSNGNSCYSLAGAVFDVYNSSNQKIGSITTDASGRGKLYGLPPESGYYIVEVTPPKGFAKNSAAIGFYILSEQTTTVTVSNLPQNDPPAILLSKLDADTSAATPQGNASLAGAEFTVKYYNGLYSASQLSSLTPTRTWVLRTGANGTAYLLASHLVSGDPFYYATNGDPTLPLGTVTIQETKAPVGYLINSEVFVRQITSAGTVESVRTYNAPIVKEDVIRGGVSIEKWDFDLNRKASPQGDATLAGAVFEIYNRSANSVVVGGKTYAPGAVVHTMTTDATGTATTANDLLPYGQYEIVEKTPPTGYLGTGVIRQTFNVTSDGVIVSLKTSATAIKNNVIRGGIEIEKRDIERDERKLKQGDATLEGAVIEIWNRSKNSVFVNGVEYAQNAVVHTMTTNADGWAGTAGNLLPYGTYEIKEKTPPVGYLNTGIISQTIEIRENGVIVNMTASEDVIKNNVIRGGARIEKWDNEIDEHRAQGGATLEGAVFELVNRSADSVLVLGVLYKVGEVVYTFATDSTGSALTPTDLLPYGTYEVREVSPPTGYLATGVLSRTFTIREHGVIVEMNTSNTTIKNNPIRGDLRGVKISDGDAYRMANIPFSITSKTTGESHVIVTDANGEFSTATAWNPHDQNTNRGETAFDGVWFGELDTLNNDLGALLYDTYVLEELPCEANKDKALLKFEVSVYRHMTVVDLGTLTNDYIAVPGISTTAMEKETTTGSAYVSEATTILDTVYYSGLKAGKEYTVKGILMDKATNAPLLIDDKQVTAEKTFKALSESGTVSMEFAFNSLALQGKAVVVFESLVFEGKEIASHADIADEGQTVTFSVAPKIKTSAAGADGKKELSIHSEVKIVDTISYENLTPNETYTLKGILMDKSTKKPLLVDGREIRSETTFKAAAASGTATVTFTLNSLSLQGKALVVFESLEYKGKEIATHADIADKGQTVTFPVLTIKIKTSAAGADGKKDLDILGKVTIVDTVSYENLTPNETYTLKGILMDKATDKPLLVDSKEIKAETTFKATAASGTTKVTFTLNSLTLKGKTVVVFESLEYKGKEIAVHKDIEDSGQTVTFKAPKIGTSAKGKDGNKLIPLDKSAVVIDTVTYENLTVGDKYTLKGVLMDKSTGKPVLIDGKEVRAETAFEAKTASGTASVTFTFDSTTLEGKTLVVFETLESNGKEIARHTDINDAAQTVTVQGKTPATPTGNPKTGDDRNPVLWAILLVLGLVGCAVAVVLVMRKRNPSFIKFKRG